DDCYAAAVWTVGNAAALGFDPGAVAVGGASAGGNLAAAVALMARDRGGPALAHQLLVYPAVGNDDSSQSFQDNGEGYGLDRTTMRWYWDHYVRDQTDASNPLAAPLLAEDLSGLPPALVITAEYDPLRDDGEAYADRLRQAGVETACSRYDGMIHGFFGMSAVLDKGAQADVHIKPCRGDTTINRLHRSRAKPTTPTNQWFSRRLLRCPRG
ncbi:alpha/beta hydrolase, partial [candidate division KSB1 bacterium]|nr:alpha/beta hydrolase [candidate division KSB1 bacterium]